MGEVKHPQDAKRERKARGHQEEEGAPGNSAHKLVKDDVKRHREHRKEIGILEK